MAIPRVFISSTFYDLKQVREDLERFIKELGYESVRHESGNIPYGKDDKPEKYAYREVELCDVLVSIIGGRHGSESSDAGPYSISQQELKTAIERGVQVFIFIERSVYAEYSTYKLNKGNDTIKYVFVDDPRVYQFIEEVYGLPSNNPIATFETSYDIIKHLRLQWAGLFQRFLQEQQRLSEVRILNEMKGVASTLRDLVDYFRAAGTDKDEAIRNILTINHPIFQRLAELTGTPYRVIFTNFDELETWIKTRGFVLSDIQGMIGIFGEQWIEFELKKDRNQKIKISGEVFDSEQKLRVFSPQDWSDSWVIAYDGREEDIPF